MGVSPSGWCFLIVISGLLPLLAVRTAYQVRKPGRTPTAAQHLISVVFSQGMSLFLALFAMRYDGLELFPRPELDWKDPVLALAFLALTLGTLPMRWRWKPLEQRSRNLWLYPRSTPDLVRWAAVALIAGTVEEIVYRGVLLQLWRRVLGSWWPAMLVCALVFALAHFVQGWRAVVVIVAFAAASHGIVYATGDLYTAMFVHVVYDFLAGVLLLRLARGDGLLPAQAAADA
jgi:membrane protease YdiL (CAAX protease family)